MITIHVCEAALSVKGAATGAALPDHAGAVWNGLAYATQSAHGACCKLARILVDAGCPDQPWETRGSDGQRRLFGASLHGLARLTVSSPDAGSPRLAKWAPRPEQPNA